MTYNHQLKPHETYDSLFHNTTDKRLVRGKKDDQILNYHLFPGIYEQPPSARRSRDDAGFNDPMYSTPSSQSFNDYIDRSYNSFDIRRPIATRSQMKRQYEHDNQSLYSRDETKKNNEILNYHLENPTKNRNGFNLTSTDLYDKKGSYEDFF